MQAKKERTHSCGVSNLDYRRFRKHGTAKFKEELNKTQNFGTMGRTGLAYEPKESKGLVSARDKYYQEPRLLTTHRYYLKSSKQLNMPALITRRRRMHLEDPTWSEKVFVGEDVARLRWYDNAIAPIIAAAGEKSTRSKSIDSNYIH